MPPVFTHELFQGPAEDAAGRIQAVHPSKTSRLDVITLSGWLQLISFLYVQMKGFTAFLSVAGQTVTVYFVQIFIVPESRTSLGGDPKRIPNTHKGGIKAHTSEGSASVNARISHEIRWELFEREFCSNRRYYSRSMLMPWCLGPNHAEALLKVSVIRKAF